MKVDAHKLCTKDILREAAVKYGVEVGTFRQLKGFENIIYEGICNKKKVVLRFSHLSRRTKSAVDEEMNYIGFLSQRGVEVPKVFYSLRGRLFEIIGSRESRFIVVGFEKVRGVNKDITSYTEGMIQSYGRLIGKIHRLSKNYQSRHRRDSWSNSEYYNLGGSLPENHKRIVARIDELKEYLRTLPKSKSSYGLIHNDAHTRNLLVSNHKLTLIDFDSSLYNWYVSDIAVIIFNILVFDPNLAFESEQKRKKFISGFLKLFMEGYRRENRMDARWMKEIPQFLRLREFCQYKAMYSINLSRMGDEDRSIINRFMYRRKSRLEQGIPFIDFDFENF